MENFHSYKCKKTMKHKWFRWNRSSCTYGMHRYSSVILATVYYLVCLFESERGSKSFGSKWPQYLYELESGFTEGGFWLIWVGDVLFWERAKKWRFEPVPIAGGRVSNVWELHDRRRWAWEQEKQVAVLHIFSRVGVSWWAGRLRHEESCVNRA